MACIRDTYAISYKCMTVIRYSHLRPGVLAMLRLLVVRHL